MAAITYGYHTSNNKHSFRGSSCSCARAWQYSRQQYPFAFGQERAIPFYLMTYTAISGIGMDIYVVEDRTVGPCRLQCCRMVITFYQKLVRLFPQRWQHHRLITASIIAFIIQQLR